MQKNRPAESLALIKCALTNPQQDPLAKAFTQSGAATTGLTFYDLDPVVLTLYPVHTPLRNQTARVLAGRGIQANWKAVTGLNINGTSAGVSQGNRGGVVATSTQDYMAAFRGFGLEDYVTFESDYAADGLLDIKARAVLGLLQGLMIGEEKIILGGNTSVALGQPTAPTVVAATGGGALPDTTQVSVRVAALSLDGFLNGSVANGVVGLATRTNADGSTDSYGGGTSKVSAAAAVVTGTCAGNNAVTASTPAIVGALGYAWFWGTAGNEVLGAITTINSLKITAAAAGTQAASSLGSSDNSTNALVCDGLLSQVAKPGSGAYVYAMPTGTAGTGTPLTADGVGGVAEIDAALKSFWDNYRLSPNTIWVSSQEQTNITHKVLQGGATGAQRFMINVEQGNVAGGDLVTSYLNKYSMDGARAIPVKLHPNLPAGTILFDTDTLPYPLSGVASVKRMLLRQDYRQIDWAIKSRRWEYGVYFDGVLQNYFPPAFGVITNIANG